MSGPAETHDRPETLAAFVMPPGGMGRRRQAVRFVAVSFVGACLLAVSAKIQVPGPVPMTMQTLIVLALGATLGLRLALGSVVLYLLEGALGLPVFANTPPLASGISYLVGPTGGFLAGFLVAAGLVGYAADRGLARSPVSFALVLAGASAALLAIGWAWLAFVLSAHGGAGLGWARAFELGVKPFILGETIKVALAAIALPLVSDLIRRYGRR